jgi:SAM-dependent methyltransferase
MAQFVVEFGKTGAPPAPDGRLDAPAFHRNHEPIWNTLAAFLSDAEGDVLELGSGTGQHSCAYAARALRLTWWPSDIYDSHLASIAAWRRQAQLDNLRAPQRIDLADRDWTWTGGNGNGLTAMLCINVLHISPWCVAENLIAGAGRYLKSGGCLFVYGPFMRNGQHTAPSNAAFDASLKAENPAWGVRDIAALAGCADTAGLALSDTIAMPANNLVLVFTRSNRQN